MSLQIERSYEVVPNLSIASKSEKNINNQLYNTILTNGDDFAKLAQDSKKIHTFRYFLSKNEINENNGTLLNKELYKTIQLVTLEEFEATLDRYCEIMKTSQKNPDLWVDNDVPLLFQDSKKTLGSTFEGYAARSLTPEGTDYILVPDLHGCIQSIVTLIEDLQVKGFISLEDPLKLIKSCRLVFMGDYTDRGLWGVEVIYLLMLLKIKNPELVFLLRGNHEDGDMTKDLGFDYECSAKFGEEGLNRCRKRIEDFNNSLPLALYYGSPGKDGINYQRLACHASAEIGYRPKRLFERTQELFFDRINKFNRLSEAKEMREFKVKHGEQLVSLQDVCEDFVAITPQKPHRIGFQWCNLKVLSGEDSTYDQKLDFETNEELTLALLDRCNDNKNVVIGMDRGHQHNPNFTVNPLMEQIQKSQGCATIFKGRVATLNVSPDSFHGLKGESNENHRNFTYCIRTTGSSPSDWKEQICHVPVRTGV